MPQTKPTKPAYCSSAGYKIGQFLDTEGTVAQWGGVAVAGAGAVTTAASWWTGVGAGAGAGLIGFGGATYNVGTALVEAGNFVKYLSGQSPGVTAA